MLEALALPGAPKADPPSVLGEDRTEAWTVFVSIEKDASVVCPIFRHLSFHRANCPVDDLHRSSLTVASSTDPRTLTYRELPTTHFTSSPLYDSRGAIGAPSRLPSRVPDSLRTDRRGFGAGTGVLERRSAGHLRMRH